MKSSGLIRLSLEGDRCKIDVHLLAGLLAGQALAEPVVHNQVSSLKVRPGKRVGCCWAPQPTVLGGHRHWSCLRRLPLWIAALTNTFLLGLLVRNILLKKNTCQNNQTILAKSAGNLLIWLAVVVPLGRAVVPSGCEKPRHRQGASLWEVHFTSRFREFFSVTKADLQRGRVEHFYERYI